jgi:hypothetical protein
LITEHIHITTVASRQDSNFTSLQALTNPILAYYHLFFSIAILRNILHVPLGDALPIYCRYIASAWVSRLLLTFGFDTFKGKEFPG